MSQRYNGQYSEVQFGFDVRTYSPIDRRLVLTWDEMDKLAVNWGGKSINLAEIMPDDYFVMCQDNARLYRYSSKRMNACSTDSCRKDCKSCAQGKVGYPYMTSNCQFKLLNDVIDVLAKDSGGNFKSIVDECGIAKVCSVDEANRIEELLNKRYDSLKEYVDNRLNNKQNKITLFGDGDVIDPSTGKPVPSPESVNRVHVSYNDQGNLIKISHDDKVGSDDNGNPGWNVKYSVGGILSGRYLPPDMQIRDVVKLMLLGGPMYENSVYFGAIPDISQLTSQDDISELVFRQVDNWDHGFTMELAPIDYYGKYICIALPGKIWNARVSGGNWITLKDMWEKDNDQYVYNKDQFETKILTGNEKFRVWVFENKIWTHDEQTFVVEFEESNTNPFE